MNSRHWMTMPGPCKPAHMPQRWGWRDSDLGRLAVKASNWLTYDQEVVVLCREALRLGFTRLTGIHRDVYCAGYLHGEAQAREAWETFWSK